VDKIKLRLDKIEQALRDVWLLLKRNRSPFYTARDMKAYNRLKAEFDDSQAEAEKKQ
jgi:hypothetical protein